jgi:quercetin dioxygenase-like cupin family protein
MLFVAGLAGASGLALGYAAAKVPYPPVAVLLSTSETVIGQPITYPEGVPKVTAAIVSMQPGQATGWHRHDAPMFAYMLEGELSVDYGAEGIRVYQQGDAFLEAFHTDHNGRNTGDGMAQVLAVFIGAENVANTIPRPD